MPVFQQRSIQDFPLGNLPLREHHACLREAFGLTAAAHAWVSAGEAEQLSSSDADTLVDAAGNPLAWRGSAPGAATMMAHTSFLIVHPWQLLRANHDFLSSLTHSEIRGTIHPSAVVEGSLVLAETARILPGVYIEGNVVIGPGCKVGPNCYIRGATSIGAHCHIGQAVEIKNSIVLERTNVGHLSYVGDSVLGAGVNFGAGTITSNFRHDGGNHRAMAGGQLVDTGLRKLGCIVGDGVHTGIHTSIYPGRQLWPNTTTLPGAVVVKDVLPN